MIMVIKMGVKLLLARLLLMKILEVIVLIFVNWMILIMVKIILMIREDDSGDDFDKHDSDNPVDQCDKDCVDDKGTLQKLLSGFCPLS